MICLMDMKEIKFMKEKKYLTFCIGEIKMIPYYYPLIEKLCVNYKNIRIVYYIPNDQSKSVISQNKAILLLKPLLKFNPDIIAIDLVDKKNLNNSLGYKTTKFIRLLLTICMYSKNNKEIPDFYLKRSILWTNSYLKILKLIPLKHIKFVFNKKITRKLLEFIFLLVQKSIKFPTLEKEIIRNTKTLLIGPTNLNYSPEYSLYQFACLSKIEINIPILTWDNPSTKLTFYPLPKNFLSWNRTQANHLVKYHYAKSEDIKVFGSLFFERFIGKEDDNSSIKINYPNILNSIEAKNIYELSSKLPKKYILYLGSSKNIHSDFLERENILKILKSMQSHKEINDYKLIIKSHPANTINISSFMGCLGRENFEKILIHIGDFPVLDSELNDQKLLLKKANIILGVNTSAFIEAFALGRVVNSLLLSKMALTQENNPHFISLKKCKQLHIIDDLTKLDNLLLNHKDQTLFDKAYLKSNLSLFEDGNDNKPSDMICRFFEKKGLDY